MGTKTRPRPVSETYDIKITFKKDSKKFRIRARYKEHEKNPFERDFDTPEGLDLSELSWRRYEGERISIYVRKNGTYHSFGIIPPEQLSQKLEKMIQIAYDSIK